MTSLRKKTRFKKGPFEAFQKGVLFFLDDVITEKSTKFRGLSRTLVLPQISTIEGSRLGYSRVQIQNPLRELDLINIQGSQTELTLQSKIRHRKCTPFYFSDQLNLINTSPSMYPPKDFEIGRKNTPKLGKCTRV